MELKKRISKYFYIVFAHIKVSFSSLLLAFNLYLPFPPKQGELLFYILDSTKLNMNHYYISLHVADVSKEFLARLPVADLRDAAPEVDASLVFISALIYGAVFICKTLLPSYMLDNPWRDNAMDKGPRPIRMGSRAKNARQKCDPRDAI